MGKRKLENARRIRGISSIAPEDEEYQETIKNAKIKLEVRMEAAMPCWVTSQFHTIGESLYFIEGVLSTWSPSLRQDSLQEEEQARGKDKQSCSHISTLLEKISDEEEPSDDLSVPRKMHYHSNWKHYQDTVSWIKMSRAQDQGLQFWQTKSTAILVHDHVLADCIYRVISHNSPLPTLPPHTHTPSPLKPIASIWTTSPRSTSPTTHLNSRGLATRKPLQWKVATQIFRRVLWQNEKTSRKQPSCFTVFERSKEKSIRSFQRKDEHD